jgi:CBS domain-containing protein
MSGSVRCAKEGDDVDQVLSEMAEAQIRRLPVVDDNQRLVGIVSLGDIAAKSVEEEADVGTSLGDISSPAEPDRSESGGKQSQSQSQSQRRKH